MSDVKVSIIYYSATGTLDAMTQRLAQAVEATGATLRVRRVAETAPAEAVASNPAWQQHHDATEDEPKATPDDIVWADVVLFGTGSIDHLRSNIASILRPPLPATDVQKLYSLFGHLIGVGLDLPDRITGAKKA